MYRGYDILSSAAFRLTSNSNPYLQDKQSHNFPSVLAKLPNRCKNHVVRMKIGSEADSELIARLGALFELDQWQICTVKGPVNLSWLFNIYDETARPDLKYRTGIPVELRRAM
jgi:polyphosphate kinase